MSSPEDILFLLLRLSVGREAEYPDIDDKVWEQVYVLAREHALLGVMFGGVERLAPEKWPGKDISRKLFAQVRYIRSYNERADAATLELDRLVRDEGYRCVVLKGQGIATLYDDPSKRNPGDVDLWIDAPRAEVVALARRHCPGARAFYHHIDFAGVGEVPCELHFTPTWMNSPIHNRRLQRFFDSCREAQFSNRVPFSGGVVGLPGPEFNLVFVPVHIYRHLFAEGIGLRQIMDLYQVLVRCGNPELLSRSAGVLESLGMRRFISSLMWVLERVFGLERQFMLAVPDERGGRFLLGEIMKSGNFGRSDSRSVATSSGKMLRLLRFVGSYPSEVLWSPFFKLWQILFIRLRHNRHCNVI